MIEDLEPRKTGCKDIGRIDICEGDIVEAVIPDFENTFRIIAPVIWINNGKIKTGEGFYVGYWIDDGDYELYLLEDIGSEFLRIVGNIRYNPVLEMMISRARTMERKETIMKIRTEAMKYKGEHMSVQTLLKILWRCQNDNKK